MLRKPTSDEQERFAEGLRHLIRMRPMVEIDFEWHLLISIVATLQLALRHPQFHGPTRDNVRGFVDDLFARIEQIAPDLVALLRLGDGMDVDTNTEDRHEVSD